MTPLERLRSRLVPEGDCLVYRGARDDNGYGRINIDGRNRRAYRAHYELVHGPIPEGLVVRHTCDNPPCCDLNHLILGTVADNNRDKIERGLHAWHPSFPGWQRSLTHCQRDHEFTPENTKWTNDGRRQCRECKRIRRRAQEQAYWAARRAQKAAS